MVIEKKTIRSDIPGSDNYIDQESLKDDSKLTVGRGISLSGEIRACEQLVVEGYLEASLKNAKHVEIKPTGHINGQIEVQNAEISGYFEGSLLVTGHLIIRSTARVAGNIQYGTLQVEPGAAIIGHFIVLTTEGNNTIENPKATLIEEENITTLFEENAPEQFKVAI